MASEPAMGTGGERMIANRFNPLGRKLGKPYAYRVEYIESYNGANGVDGNGVASQWLRLPIQAKLTDELFIRFSKVRGRDYPTQLSYSLFGQFGNSFRTNAYAQYASDVWFGNKSYSDGRFSPTLNNESEQTIHIKDKVFSLTKADGSIGTVDMTSVSDEDGPTRTPFGVGAFYGGTSNAASYQAKMRLHEFWMKRDGEYLVNLLPCVDKEGIPCVYDEVSDSLIYQRDNLATYPYLAGPRI